MKRKFAIVNSRSNRELKKRLTGEMIIRDEPLTETYYDDFDINLMITKSGDIHIFKTFSLRDEDVYLLHEMGNNPWQDLAEICIMAEHLKKNGAIKVTAVVPNWKLGHHEMGTAYRKDRDGSQKLVADMLSGSCIDRLVTLIPTADMLTDLYPIEVQVPDISKLIAEDMERSSIINPLVLAVETDVLPEAQEFAQHLTWDFGLCQCRADGSHASADVCGRDILLYTHHLDGHIPEIISMLKRENSGEINCYIPWAEEEEKLQEYAENMNLITLKECPYSLSVPLETILAEWILNDRHDI